MDKGKEIIVKQGLIINAGENPTRESKLKLIEKNKIKYGKNEKEIAAKVPSEIELFAVKRAKRLQFQQFLKRYFDFKDKQEAEEKAKQQQLQREQDAKKDAAQLEHEAKLKKEAEAKAAEEEIQRKKNQHRELANLQAESKQRQEKIKELEAKIRQALSGESQSSSSSDKQAKKKRRIAE